MQFVLSKEEYDNLTKDKISLNELEKLVGRLIDDVTKSIDMESSKDFWSYKNISFYTTNNQKPPNFVVDREKWNSAIDNYKDSVLKLRDKGI